MPRGRRREPHEGKVDKESMYIRGLEDFGAGRLPLLPPEADTASRQNDYYEGYEVDQRTDKPFPGLGFWGRGN